MTKKKAIRIGGASAFVGDSSIAVPQIIKGGNADYIIMDYLAEVTMSYLARSKAKRSHMGYAPYFVDVTIAQNIKEIVKKGIKMVTNAGGVNPQACREAVLKIAEQQGVKVNVAVVEGDDLMPRHTELAARNITEMNTGDPWPENMMNMNAYLGARPIKEALDMGADIVITGTPDGPQITQ